MMTTNLFVIADVKQLRTGGSLRILLPFFRTSWCVGVLNSAIFNSFHNRVEVGTILEGLPNFDGGLNTPNPSLGTPLLAAILLRILSLTFTDVLKERGTFSFSLFCQGLSVF